MTNYSAKTVDEYISGAPKDARAHLREIRAAIKSAVPKAEEGIGYGKPFYKYHGMLAGFDAYKNHIALKFGRISFEVRIAKCLKKKGIKLEAEPFK